MHFILEEINKENFDRLMSFLKDGGRHITIDSIGGAIFIAEIMILELNKLSQEITLYGYQLCSSGFNIFHQFKGERKLLNGAFGMIHKASIHGVKVDCSGKIPESEDIRAIRNMKHLKDYKYPFLTEKEKKKYKKGQDIRFSYKRLKKIF